MRDWLTTRYPKWKIDFKNLAIPAYGSHQFLEIPNLDVVDGYVLDMAANEWNYEENEIIKTLNLFLDRLSGPIIILSVYRTCNEKNQMTVISIVQPKIKLIQKR